MRQATRHVDATLNNQAVLLCCKAIGGKAASVGFWVAEMGVFRYNGVRGTGLAGG